MLIIISDNTTQARVLSVNIDSPSIVYVSNGKIRYEVPNARNLTPQALSPSSLYPSLDA